MVSKTTKLLSNSDDEFEAGRESATVVTTEMTCSKSTYATVCQTVQSKPFVYALLDHDEGKLRLEIHVGDILA